MGVKEYQLTGDNRHLLNEYHRQLDSLGEWQIDFLPDTKHQTYAFAHDLAHVIATLQHVFSNSKSSGKTKNLMEICPSGSDHFQWDQIQDPSRVWMKWNQEESEGEAYGKNTHYVCIKQEIVNKIKSKAKYFYLPDGKIADFSDLTPSGFYTAEDGTVKTSYGAVACIRDKGYDYYFMFKKELKNQNRFKFMVMDIDLLEQIQFVM